MPAILCHLQTVKMITLVEHTPWAEGYVMICHDSLRVLLWYMDDVLFPVQGTNPLLRCRMSVMASEIKDNATDCAAACSA